MTMPDTPQPGQMEQRMDERRHIMRASGLTWAETEEAMRRGEKMQPGHRITRPTADLGGDGGLVEALANMARAMRYGPDQAWIEAAADRLILYREALERLVGAVKFEVPCVLNGLDAKSRLYGLLECAAEAEAILSGSKEEK
jgi:hypothetical protein